MDKNKVIEIAKNSGFDAHDMSCDFTVNFENILEFAAAILTEAAKVCLLQGETKSFCDAHFDAADWCHSALYEMAKELVK
jgi:hypothetical protein